MSKSYDVDAARARIRQVFQYLKEMHRVRMPPVIDLEDREWRLRLDTLPRSPHVERGFQFGKESSADASGFRGGRGCGGSFSTVDDTGSPWRLIPAKTE